jgi:glycosyltransferase involved in cell wall biosynthesis
MDRPPLLFLSPRVPWPLNTGAKIRTRALLEALAGAFAVDYAGFLQPDLTEAQARATLARCAGVTLFPEPATTASGKAWLGLRTLLSPRPATIAKYWSRPLAAHVRRWIGRHPGGAIHADHLHMAPYLDLGGTGPKVIDEHNVETDIVRRMAERYHRRWLKPYLYVQAERMRRTETELAGRAGRVLAVSEGDARQLAMMAPRTPVDVIPNGVDLNYFAPPAAGRSPRPGRLVFTGSMNWLPNEDGMLYFMREVWPLLERPLLERPLLEQAPPPDGGEWSVDIVGHQPSAAVRALAAPRVRVTGSVDDVRPYVHEGTVFIVPLRIGGGSRLKILEAFAMGIPVVSTAVGCEGLGAVDGRHLLIADTPETFRAAIARIAQSPALAQQLTQAAKQHVRGHFSWEAIGGRLVEVYLGYHIKY